MSTSIYLVYTKNDTLEEIKAFFDGDEAKQHGNNAKNKGSFVRFRKIGKPEVYKILWKTNDGGMTNE